MNNKIVLLTCIIGFFLTSCFDKQKPNYQFMANTDMYEPVGYETYYPAPESILKGGMEAQLPAIHSIRRGWLPFEYSNTNEDFEKAKTQLKNPLLENTDDITFKENIKQGANLFNIYCMVCHGPHGDGQGILVKREKFLGIPNFKDRNITQGSIYHTIYYGKNAMGSYASQISEKERWQVALYVEELRKKLMK